MVFVKFIFSFVSFFRFETMSTYTTVEFDRIRNKRFKNMFFLSKWKNFKYELSEFFHLNKTLIICFDTLFLFTNEYKNQTILFVIIHWISIQKKFPEVRKYKCKPYSNQYDYSNDSYFLLIYRRINENRYDTIVTNRCFGENCNLIFQVSLKIFRSSKKLSTATIRKYIA